MRALSFVLLLAAACMASAYTIDLNSGWVTDQTAQMAPIECPKGFRPARGSDHALLVAFLDAEFAAAMKRGGDISTQLPAYYCRAGVAPATKSYSALNGCVSLAPNAGWAMAEGVVAYKCAGSGEHLSLGVEADGQYA